MSRSSSAAASTTTPYPIIKPENYKHSPVHYAVVLRDHAKLNRLISALPKLSDPNEICTEFDSLSQERVGDEISAVLDRRDVPFRETPLHLAVRLNDAVSAQTLAAAGADVSLQNAAGWNPLLEALCRRSSEIARILLQFHHRSSWSKWRRRLPRLIAVLRRMRDFYMEISFHFESSVIPFVGKIAPSDTYKIWKRDGNLRADTSLAGFDGLKIQRADQSFLFLGDGDCAHNIPPGSLLVLNHDDRSILDAFENAGGPMSESNIDGFCAQTSVYRPGMDVTRAELVGRTNWRRQEKTESVGGWKAKVYEIHNVVFSFRSRKIATTENDAAGSEQVLPLELDEDDDGFLVCENPNFAVPDRRRRHSSFVKEDRDFISVGRNSVDVYPSSAMAPPRRSTALKPLTPLPPLPQPQTKEKEYVRSLRPSVWLTEQFPLKTEELLPLLDILANKVKAVRRLRELLTTKFPPGTFPVKVAIPVVPTVRVVITFTKFVDLPSTEQFYTPLSSPSHFGDGGKNQTEEDEKSDSHYSSLPSLSSAFSTSSSSSSTWLRRNNSRPTTSRNQRSSSSSMVGQGDPFDIPSGYNWTSTGGNKSGRMKKPKSTKKSN